MPHVFGLDGPDLNRRDLPIRRRYRSYRNIRLRWRRSSKQGLLVKTVVAGLFLASAALVSDSALASTVRWVLSGVTFSDGGTASGWFDIDPGDGVIGRYALFTTAGTGTVGAHAYTPSTGSDVRGSSSGASADVMFFNNAADGFQLRMSPSTELDGSGGTHDLDTAEPNFNIECADCSPYRYISAGQLIGITDNLFGDGFD